MLDLEATDTCSNCGYELTGLGLRGQCPECGQYFDHATHEGVGEPITPTDRTRLWLDKHLRTTTIAVVGGLMLLAILVLMLAANIAGPTGFSIFAVLVVAWLLILVASYFEET
ncbi:hypothetical protein ACERK3_12645 [Phycisphaerales bacterium AB-hyl4]|uniref:Uncharacterized protein n=1 Tax=Natronomicrosphaera hydrolytica TaxID=3242702 RepID=A0ABV4U823_9BACT